ncbi:hypothetical protein B0O44_101240 [Pedobacter nutrimenti]|uniref:SsrA-binding protein n=1 Tax=Pedobacter nutrimenti TaxID=1241337 RepID=A0A318UMV6_9SPHI|nr:hypothetical protein B0O44_101240 [Pedobacter nutrimenti]
MTGLLKIFFKILVRLNNALLPSYSKKDPFKLSPFQKLILGYRYWALTRFLS